MVRFFLSGFIFLILSLLPDPALSEGLPQAVKHALANHPSVEAARAEKDSRSAQHREEKAGHFPTLTARAEGARAFINNSTSRGSSVTRDSDYTYIGEGEVRLTQPLFRGFATSNRIRAAKKRQQSAVDSVIDVQERIALRVVQAYLEILRTRESLALGREMEKKFDAHLETIKTSFDQGGIDEAALTQARDLIIRLENSLIDLQGQYDSALANYMEAVGEIPYGDMPSPPATSDKIPEDESKAIQLAFTTHPQIKALVKEAKATEFDRAASKGSLYPELEAEFSYIERDQKEEVGGELVDGRGTLRLRWNINLGGAELARIKRTSKQTQQAMARTREAKREVARTIRNAYANLRAARRQSELAGERLELFKDLLGAYENQFQAGRRTLLELMQIRNQLFETRLVHLESAYRLKDAEFFVLANMGQLVAALGLRETEETAQNTKGGAQKAGATRNKQTPDKTPNKKTKPASSPDETGKSGPAMPADKRQELLDEKLRTKEDFEPLPQKETFYQGGEEPFSYITDIPMEKPAKL